MTPHTLHSCPESDGHSANQLYALISERLHTLGLVHWTHVVLAWLYRYDGIECCYFADEETQPAQQVLELLNMLTPGVTDADLATQLAWLPFVTWRMADDEGHRWDFRAEHCQGFLSRIGASGTPNCWSWDNPWPSEEAVVGWFLEQIAESAA